MIPTRELFQEYIDAIYQENRTILFYALTGFGTTQFFMKPILEDLLSYPKYCLMVASMGQIVDNIQENFFRKVIDKYPNPIFYDVVENRTKTSMVFKNGSLIEFKSAHEISELNNTEDYDILYIDSINTSKNLHTYLGYLLNSFKKIIITDNRIIDKINTIGESRNEFMEKVKPNYKPLYYFTIDKIEDLTIELRRMKLKQIKDRCMTI